MNSNFRNLRVYRIHTEWPDTEEALSDLLAAAEFKPCGAFAERSGGFEAPVDNAGDLLCRRLVGNTATGAKPSFARCGCERGAR